MGSQGYTMYPLVDPTSRVISGASNAVEGTDQKFSTTGLMVPGKFGNGLIIDEATTNLVPSGTINNYPSYGNGWGTYNTNHYNNGVFFSIGTITSVTNNIVTYVPSDGLRTYDVVQPQTTGGGLTAGTNYFIKAISTTQFTVHAYNSSQDGSQGFAVHSNIANDVRTSINATSFPTMWWGPPHLPNSGLVKEIIHDGFNKDGRIHDCLRMHTEFRSDGIADFMAYGVYPPVTGGVTYTVSFQYRAVTSAGVGRTSTFSMHTGAGWAGAPSFTFSLDWKKYVVTLVAPNSGGTNMYFNAGAGYAWDISEIQFEQKPYATSFINITRSQMLPTYPNYLVRTVSLWVKSTSNKVVDGVGTSRTLLRQIDVIDTYPQWSLYVANTTTSDCLPGTATPITAGSAILKVKWKTDGVNVTTYLCTVSTINILDRGWHHISCEFGLGSICRISVDDKYGDTLTIPETSYYFNGLLRVGYDSTSELAGNFLIDELRLDNRTYSRDDIRRRFISGTEYYDPFNYSVTCI